MSIHTLLPRARVGAARPRGSAVNVVEQPSSLLVWREGVLARERGTEYLARAYACRDMAVRAHDTQDKQFVRAMTMVWGLLADKCAGARNTAAPEVSP